MHGNGVLFHVAAPGISRGELLPILARLHDMDGLFSTYKPTSEINAIASGRMQLSDAGPEVRHVLAVCAEFRERTDGYFDVRPHGRRLDPSGYVKGWAV